MAAWPVRLCRTMQQHVDLHFPAEVSQAAAGLAIRSARSASHGSSMPERQEKFSVAYEPYWPWRSYLHSKPTREDVDRDGEA